MKVHCVAALVLLACSPALAQQGRPTFAEPRFPASKACAQTFGATRAPGNHVMSVLRVAKNKDDKDFLEVGAGRARRDRSQCTIEIRFEKALATAEVLSIDMRGDEMKDPDTAISYVISLGRQSHKVEYARGRWIDGAASDAFKRFQVPLIAGTRELRIKLSGTASSSDGTATAIVALDSMDMCVVDPARPDVCGLAGRANPSAAAASAPP